MVENGSSAQKWNVLKKHFCSCRLGADVIYDPICLPHLVRVLSVLLHPKQSDSSILPFPESEHTDNANHGKDVDDGSHGFKGFGSKLSCNGIESFRSRDRPVAYIASVIRNIDTFNHFMGLVEQANLSIRDVTDELRPLKLLAYMYSYNRSSIRLFTLTFK